jgi:hypothetical protein
MIKRGVLALALLGCTPIPLISHSQDETDPTSESIFTDIDTTKSNPPSFKIVDIDDVLDESPAIEGEFRSLSQADKDTLTDVADLINEAFSRALFDLIKADELSDTDDSECECLSIFA